MKSETDSVAATQDEGPGENASADDRDVAELERLLAISRDTALRSAADLDNLQKRFGRELANGRDAERRRVLTAWSESLDDLERALAHADNADEGANAISEGVRSIVTNAVASVASFGYPRFGVAGDTFDPQLHEVVSTVPAGAGVEPNVVVAVVKPGYGTAESLLRPASVIVSKDVD